MTDLQLSEDQQKELASAEEQADLMRSMMAQSQPSAALGVVAQALASQKSSPGQTTEVMDDTAREGKRGNRNEEEEPTRGLESKGAQKWHRGDKKGGYGDGWSRHNKSWGHQAYQAKDRRQDKAREENAWGMSETKEGVFALTDSQLRELCGMMARLVLRHSDQMSIDRCESGFMLFLQAQGMLSLVPDLYQVSQTWRKAKEETSETINLP